jgi:hypothetical protein
MKNRDFFAVVVLILGVFGLFVACDNSNRPDPLYMVSFEANGGTPTTRLPVISPCMPNGILFYSFEILRRTGGL